MCFDFYSVCTFGNTDRNSGFSSHGESVRQIALTEAILTLVKHKKIQEKRSLFTRLTDGANG